MEGDIDAVIHASMKTSSMSPSALLIAFVKISIKAGSPALCAETRLLGSHFLCVECASFDLFSAGMLFSCTKKVRIKRTRYILITKSSYCSIKLAQVGTFRCAGLP